MKSKNENRKKTGTREWAEHNRNIQLGCENDCRYCYASGMTDRVFVYAIRRRSDGLFSTGGSSPKFTKKGKRWSTIGHVKAHLSMFVGFGYDNSSVYAGCELVAFEISTVETEKIAMEQLMETYFQERKEREQLRRLEYQRQKTVAEIRKLAELKAKYEVKR